MKRIRSYGIAAVAVTGLFLIGSVMESRESRVKGAYSSPVSVMNTTSAPAINSSMDNPGRIPYQALISGASGCAGSGSCTQGFPPVPAGHRVVITGISLYTLVTGTPAGVRVLVTGGTGMQINYSAPFFFDGSGNSDILSFTPVEAYFDAGQAPSVDLIVLGPSSTLVFNPNINLIGYELDCTAAPCSPIKP